jgi:hypothetical protein
VKKLLMIAALVAAPVALAEPSYDYIDLGFQAGGEMDLGVTIDTTGFALEGSKSLSDDTYVQFEYNSIETDPSGVSVTDWALSIGVHGEFAYAEVGLASGGIDFCDVVFPPCEFDDSGFTIDLGLRGMVTDSFELNAHVGHSDMGDFDSFTNYGIGGVFMFSDGVGMSFNYDMRAGDIIDLMSYGIGLRINFE